MILHKAWRNAGLEKARVRGRDGHTYSIVYGGKPGGSLGPDFTDAVVERDDGVVFRGDIEIHVRESDWRAHGHHTDPRYNGVVLHVVVAESNGSPALKATGSTIPLLALNWMKSRNVSGDSITAPAADTPANVKLELDLASAGLQRFHSQAAGIALDIDAFGADQALWLGILGALGYPRNKRAFRAVATRANWESVSKFQNASEIEHHLLHASGLADSGSPRFPLKGSAPEWVRPFGRPANAPQSRIKSISALVPIWRKNGGIVACASEIVKNADNPKLLADMFRPHLLLQAKQYTPLGKARASEITVNVILPAVFAMATHSQKDRPSSTYLKNKALQLFSNHPKLSENLVTKEAVIALGIDHTVPNVLTARDQQGLIALYREMFRHGIKTRQPRLPGV